MKFRRVSQTIGRPPLFFMITKNKEELALQMQEEREKIVFQLEYPNCILSVKRNLKFEQKKTSGNPKLLLRFGVACDVHMLFQSLPTSEHLLPPQPLACRLNSISPLQLDLKKQTDTRFSNFAHVLKYSLTCNCKLTNLHTSVNKLEMSV